MRSDADLLLAQLRPLKISDRQAFDQITAAYPPYSDFDFPSLWSWNVTDQIEWGLFLDCLIVRFADYETSEPFFTFLGTANADRVSRELLILSGSLGWPEELHLVPDCCICGMSDEEIVATENMDNFDYMFNTADHIKFTGNSLKKQRWKLNKFTKQWPGYRPVEIDLRVSHHRSQMLGLWNTWNDAKGYEIRNESRAFERFLASQEYFDACATGIEVQGELAAFDVTVIGPSGCGNSLFSKSDYKFEGINSVLAQEVAKRLVARDCLILNFEQDLGIPGLRQSKRGFAPSDYLKKYDVRWRMDLEQSRFAASSHCPKAAHGPGEAGRVVSEIVAL